MSKPKNSKRPVKKNKPKQNKMKRATPRARSAMSTSRLLSKHRHLLSFENHEHQEVSLLRAPSPATISVARRVVFSRFVVSTGTNKTGLIVFNPYYLVQYGAIRRYTTTASDVQSVYMSNSANTFSEATPLQPYTGTVGTLATGWSGSTAATGGIVPASGNLTGLRRWVGMRVTVTFLGSNLNAGGEIYSVNDPDHGSILGSTTIGTLLARRHVRRHPMPSASKSITFNFVPQTSTEQSFQSASQWLCLGNDPSAIEDLMDPDVFGGYAAAATINPFHSNYAPKGWNLGIIMKSAVANQDYEVYFECLTEGEFRSMTSTLDEPVYPVPTDTVIPADPVGSGMVSTVRAASCLAHPMDGKMKDTTFWSRAAKIAADIEGVVSNPLVQQLGGTMGRLLLN